MLRILKDFKMIPIIGIIVIIVIIIYIIATSNNYNTITIPQFEYNEYINDYNLEYKTSQQEKEVSFNPIVKVREI